MKTNVQHTPSLSDREYPTPEKRMSDRWREIIAGQDADMEARLVIARAAIAKAEGQP